MRTYFDYGDIINIDGLWIPKDPNNTRYQLFLEEIAAGGAELIQPIPTWSEIRGIRNRLLTESDWTMLSDSNPTPNKEAWETYRQALRNLPQSFETIESIVWPTKPV